MKIVDPLVSIIVITYNSAKYILETLESAKAQTYRNIELIVSDDCSKDNTVEICSNWIEMNKNRFVRTELITVKMNTGITSNCNRGVYAAKGEWIKPIAGDDVLYPHCIASFIEYSKMHINTSFFCSDADIFGDEEYSQKMDKIRIWLNNSISLLNSLNTSNEQYREFKLRNMVCAPSTIFKHSVFHLLGGFDEDIKLIEDYPLWLVATKNGYNFKCLNEKMVKYRVNKNSIQKNFTFNIAHELVLQKYIFNNTLFSLVVKFINQLNSGRKDILLCYILILTTLHKRLLWNHMKRDRN